MHFRRKNIRLPRANYAGRRRYFVTLCCERRRNAFAHDDFARRVVEVLRETASRQAFAVYAYCLMPDHLHLLVEGQSPSSNLLNFVANLKQRTTAEFHKESPDSQLWQKKFYDHILRPKDSADRIAAYIWMNPVRKGLCRKPEEYPCSGSFVLEGTKLAQSALPWTPPWRMVL